MLSNMGKDDVVTKYINLESAQACGLPALHAEDWCCYRMYRVFYILPITCVCQSTWKLSQRGNAALPLVELEGEGGTRVKPSLIGQEAR